MSAAVRNPSHRTSVDAMSDAELRNVVTGFTFGRCPRGGQGFQRVLLQLFGYVGHGKSSFINTCLMVWNNRPYQNLASSAGTDESHTTQRFTYPLTENITLVDNRGCSTMNSYESGEIYAQLANLLPLDKPVGWSQGFCLADRIVEAEPHVDSSDFIVPIFVYSVKKSIASEELEELKKMLLKCRELTGIFPIVLLTHKNHRNLNDVRDMFKNIGTERFFTLENYTQNNPNATNETHQSVLTFLHEVIRDVHFQVEHLRDPMKEMEERKISVLNYIHERELQGHERNLERQRQLEVLRIQQDVKLLNERGEMERRRLEREHKEKMKRLDSEFERLRMQDEFEHQKRLTNIQRNKKSGKKK